MARVLKTGIYAVKISGANMVYVGQSVQVELRVRKHFYNLLDNIHFNTNLQKAFNEHGESSFSWELLEEVGERSALTKRENYWIKRSADTYSVANIVLAKDNGARVRFTDSQREAFSAARKNAGKYWSERHKKSITAVYDIVSPDGVLHRTTDGVLLFCEEQGLSYTRIMDMIHGRFRQHNGWRLPSYDESLSVRYDLFDPCGNRHIVTDGYGDVTRFCEKYNLEESSLSRLRSGNRTIYKGWRWNNESSD